MSDSIPSQAQLASETEAAQTVVAAPATARSQQEQIQPLPISGRRAAFLELKRGLTDGELASTGAQKLLLDMLECAERERDEFKIYVDKFHEANTAKSVLAEKINKSTANEILFGVGVGVGGIILGYAPAVWANDSSVGPMALVIGGVLVVGATIGKLAHK